MPHLDPVEPARAGVALLADRAARARGVLVAFSDRRGGVSRPPFESLNLALVGGDDPAAVERNRALVARAAGFDPSTVALARQVHGADAIEVGARVSGVVGEADVLVARARGVVIGILAADCAPVVVLGQRGIALAHAGWRGLVAGAIERGVAAVAPAVCAWVGPCIRACCYEVGPEVGDAFEARRLPLVRGPAGVRVDVMEAARAALGRAGVGEVAVAGLCTGCGDRYFSHRREGRTGRQGAFAALLPA